MVKNVYIKANADFRNVLPSQLREIQRGIHTKFRKVAIDAVKYIRSRIAEYAPRKTGNLKKKISNLPVRLDSERGFDLITGKRGMLKIVIRLDRPSDKKILWVNYGTGIYGPNRSPIIPTMGEFLIFKIGKRWVKTRFVLGQKPQYFIESGINVSKLILHTKIKSALLRG